MCDDTETNPKEPITEALVKTDVIYTQRLPSIIRLKVMVTSESG